MEMNQNEPNLAHLVHRQKSKKNEMSQNEPKLAHLVHEPNEPKTAHPEEKKKNEPNEPKLVHQKKEKKNEKIKKTANQAPDLQKLNLNLKCQYCFKEFKSIPSKRRHELHRCKRKNDEKVELIDELKKQTQLVKQLLEEKQSQFEAVLNEKERYIDILRDKMSSTTNHNTFNIIRNNIYTMKPLQFLNTFCINNPSLEQVMNCIQDSELDEEEIKRIKEANQLDAKHIIAQEFDSILKRHNRELIQDKPLTCGNVLFSNDGSNRRFIAKGNNEWQFYSSDDKLEQSTQLIMDKLNDNIEKPIHMSKKDRTMVHKHIKNMNDFNKSRDALLNTLENSENKQGFLEDYGNRNLSIAADTSQPLVSIHDIDEPEVIVEPNIETTIEAFTEYKEEIVNNNNEINTNVPFYEKNKKYNIMLDCGQEHYYDENNNVFNKDTKKFIGVRIHDDECPCGGTGETEDCWYYVKYLNEF
jgi:hypothetical protein